MQFEFSLKLFVNEYSACLYEKVNPTVLADSPRRLHGSKLICDLNKLCINQFLTNC